jgi:hypothetical protein
MLKKKNKSKKQNWKKKTKAIINKKTAATVKNLRVLEFLLIIFSGAKMLCLFMYSIKLKIRNPYILYW